MVKKILLLSAFAMFSAVSAQKKHTVAKGDNPYNIAKRYGITLDELLKLNPGVKDGKVNIGDVLVVDKKSAATASERKTAVPSTPKNSGEIGYITLQPKQTVYGITKQYHISEAELRAINPNLDSNMKIGDKVALPLEKIRKYGAGQTQEAAKAAETSTANGTVVKQNADADSYIVQPKDNYYRITKNFNITQDQLFAMNPGLEQKGLQPGDVLKVKGNAQKAVETIAERASQNTSPAETVTAVADDYVTYTVRDGDTVFGILNRFGISLDELLSLNPELSNGLKAGMVLKIRKLDTQYIKKSGDALNVVIMLPFGFDTNDSKYRSISTDFLTGAKLAIERNAKSGQKLDVKVVDAGNEASFKNSLTQINKNNTDLIIGPFFKSSVVEVLNYVQKEKIPVVAPFANSEDLYGYDNLIIVETTGDSYAKRIVEEVGKVYSDQKIYIVSGSDKADANLVKSGLEKSLKNPNITMVNSPLDIQLDKNMMTGQSAPVIAILASSNEELGNAFTSRIIQMNSEVPQTKSFSLAYSSSFEKKEKEIGHLVYLMDRKINTEGSFEKEILGDYKEKYCKTPSKYAVIGFDVVNDILTRENKKGEVFKQIGKVQTQLATKFEYVRAKKNGAYINTGYRVVRLEPQN